MALIKCPECGKEISNEAKECPHCGKQLKKPWYKSWVFWVIIAVIIFFVAFTLIQYRAGVELARQSDSYKEAEEIIERSKRISTEAQDALDWLDKAQDSLDRLEKAY